MNYKTRIAFLGKRPIKDYRPSSNWVVLNDGEKWNANMPIKEFVGREENVHFHKYPEHFKSFYIFWDDKTMKKFVGNEFRILPRLTSTVFYDTLSKSVVVIQNSHNQETVLDFVSEHGSQIEENRYHNSPNELFK